jgi:hypothetical protein
LVLLVPYCCWLLRPPWTSGQLGTTADTKHRTKSSASFIRTALAKSVLMHNGLEPNKAAVSVTLAINTRIERSG